MLKIPLAVVFSCTGKFDAKISKLQIPLLEMGFGTGIVSMLLFPLPGGVLPIVPIRQLPGPGWPLDYMQGVVDQFFKISNVIWVHY